MSNIPNEGSPSGQTGDRATATPNTEPPAILDAVFYGLLQNQRRRYLLYCLLDHEGEVSLSHAVDIVTAWETDCAPENVRSTDRRCVYSALRRRHIPKLEAENVVAYDAEAGTISLGLDAGKVTRWLTPDKEDRWCKYYLGLAAISGVVLLADLLVAFPVPFLEGWGHAVVATLFLGLTVFLVYPELE